MRKILLGLCLLGGALSLGSSPALAQVAAGTITLSGGGGSCAYDTITTYPNGGISVTCTSAVTSRPGPPIIGAATPGDGSASIAFSPPTTGGGGITGYTASCSESGIAPFAGSSTLGASPRTVTLPNGPTYLCSVTATNAIGTSDPSNTVSVTPAAVVGCGALPTGTSIVNWTNYSNPGNTIETGTISTGFSKAYKFNADSAFYPNGTQVKTETSTTTGGSNKADITIATCPGVFTNPQAGCVLTNVKLSNKLTSFNPAAPSYECILDNIREYYVNIRPNVLYPNVAKVLVAQPR